MVINRRTVSIYVSIIIALASLAISLIINTYTNNNMIIESIILSQLFFLISMIVGDILIEEKNSPIIDGISRIVMFKRDYFSQLASLRIRQSSILMNNLSKGFIHISNLEECLSVYCDFIKSMNPKKGSIIAASRVDPESVWLGEIRAVNIDFVQRGGNVERIFLLSKADSDSFKKRVENEMSLQLDAKIHVKYCWKEDIISEAFRDFIINPIDKVCVEFNVQAGLANAGQVICDHGYVNDLIAYYKKIKIFSKDWERGAACE